MFENLSQVKRLLMEVDLVPVQGDRFQPTGFPDIGGATYNLPDGTRMLLVESAQSMANRLEATIIGPDNEIIEELKGIPYIRARLVGKTETTTNSLTEAHRINSPWIISDKAFQEKFKEDAAYEKNKPLNWQKIARALMKYDTNSLLHGAFLANLGDGRAKVPRALSAFIEAKNVREVVSGGIKNNPIDPTGTLRAKGYPKNVYGNVPYQRTEYTAEIITAFFNLDVGLLKSYDLGQDAFELLVALALYKIGAFIEDGTRLRTACDLKANGGIRVKETVGFSVPDKTKILQQLRKKIDACKSLFADPPVTEIKTEAVIKGKGKKADEEEEVEQD